MLTHGCRAKAQRVERASVRDEKRRRMMDELERREKQVERERSQEDVARAKLKVRSRQFRSYLLDLSPPASPSHCCFSCLLVCCFRGLLCEPFPSPCCSSSFPLCNSFPSACTSCWPLGPGFRAPLPGIMQAGPYGLSK